MSAGTTSALEFLAGGGEMGALIRTKDWSQTPLGRPETWPQSLRIAVSIMLDTHFGMHIAWGEDYLQLYNDGYRPVLGETKHPAALGLPIRDSFPEIWDDFVRPKFADVMRGEPFGAENLLIPQYRNRYLEEGYFTFSYSPIRDERGRVGGVLTTETETTEHVIRERRLQTSRNVASLTSTVSNPQQAGRVFMQALQENAYDIPFALLYVIEAREARLAEHIRLDNHPIARPERIDGLASPETAWPLTQVLEADAPQLIGDLSGQFGTMPGGAWPEPAQSAYLLPIHRLDRKQIYGVLVLGVNPRRVFDTQQREFFESLAEQATRLFATASALEEERRRTEALRAIDAAKTAFFSNVSHEFRTPLTLMLGPIEEALNTNGQLPDSVHENLQTAHRNALRLQKLVNTLLDFSRIEAGRMQASYEPTDLAALTTDLASTFRSAIERAGMSLVVDCPPLPEVVYVDGEMWEKIVLNLLSNAHKYTLEGRISVRLSADEGQAVLRVEDTGVGIPADELPRIFERFHRVAGSRGRSFEGTGIGLSLLKELVGLHGGTISAESEPGLGSTFTVRIPLGKAHLPAEFILDQPQRTVASALGNPFLTEALGLLPNTSPEHEVVFSEKSISEKRPHIVLADDNADMRAYVQRLLEPHYRVSLAPDGQVARWLVAEHRPDLVLSDVMMPVMDGLELLKTLKADPQTATIPVVLLSARAGEEASIEGYEAGADDYLVKPFSANELLARVRAQLNIARMRSENERQLQTLFEQAPVGIAVLRGPEHTFDLVNDFYVNITKRQHPDQLVGKPLLEALPELAGQGFEGLLTNVVETGVPFVAKELSAQLLRDGQLETIYINFSYQPLPAPDSGVFVVVTDVTSQVLARRRIEANERLLRDVFEQAPTAIAMFSGPDFRIELANPNVCRMWGRTQGEVLGKPLFEALSEAAGQGFEEILAGVLQTGHPFVGKELPVILKRNGRPETVFFDFVYHPLPETDGHADRIVLVAEEVTERRQARQNLEASNKQLQNLFEQAPVGIAMLRGPEYTFELANDFYVNLANRQHPDQLVGKPLFEALPELVGQGFEPLLDNVVETDVPFVARERVVQVMKSGQLETIYVNFSFQPLPAPDSGVFIVVTDVTESILSRRKIEENEDRLRLAVESAELGTWEYDPRTSTITGSERTVAMHGLRPGEPFNLERGLSTAAETDRQRVAEAVANALQPGSGGDYNVEYTLSNLPDGQPRTVQAKGKVFFDENGEAYRLIGTALDITEERRAEEALRESEEKFRSLADNISQLAWMTDADGWIFWYNQRWFDYTGTTLEAMQGWGWQAVHAPEEVERVTAKFKHHIATGEIWEDTFPLRSKEGEYRWFLSRAVPIRDAAGKVLRWFGTNTDVTEAKRAEAALRESDRWFRQLADSMPQIVWTARPDGYLDYFNQRWYQFIDGNQGFGDAGWLPILHPDDRQPCLDRWQRCLQTGEPYRFEFRLDDVRQPGRYRWYLALATAFRDTDGRILKWMGTCTDIDDQKTEAARLEALVQNRTEALNQANGELQRTNLNLSQFAYVASHDLQEPLRKIQAFGDLLFKRNAAQLDEAGTERVRRMQDAAERMSGLIKDLLEYSRVSSYRETFAPVELNPLLASVRSDLAVLIREKKGSLHADPLPTVNGDATQLRQVLQNLLSNALKFSRPDVPPVVEIRCRVVPGAEAKGLSLAPDAVFYEISFSDNGIGFDETYADRIFEAFQRLHGRGDYPGTGIGLAIVRKVAENHHGGVSVSSRVGEGATFRVYLPVGEGGIG